MGGRIAEDKPTETPAAKPEDKPAAKSEDKSADTSSALGLLRSATTAALPVVVSAVVSVGFVAFAGKAVLWTRFETLQVPGDQVVKAVPQGEAVAIGASMLLIFGALGVLAALGVYLVDRGGRATASMSRGLLVILAVEVVVAIWKTEAKPLTSSIVATEFVVLAVGVIFWSTFVAGLTKERKAPGGKREEGGREYACGPFFYLETKDRKLLTATVDGSSPGEAKNGITKNERIFVPLLAALLAVVAYGIALLAGGGAGWAWVAVVAVVTAVFLGAVLRHCVLFWNRKKAEEAEARTKREEEEEEKARKKAEKEARKTGKKARRKAKRKAKRRAKKKRKAADAKGGAVEEPTKRGVDLVFWGAVLVLALAALVVAVPSFLLHEWWLAIALGAVALLGGALWQIASLSKERFIWYGLAVFISVPLFGTVMQMASNADEPKVQPMALIRSTDGPDESIQGLYVTETSDRIYFANVASEGCEEKVTPHSGRLLWVPKEEVVAMAVGPLQNVEQAGRSALEMSYDLTPGIETAGATFDLPNPAETEMAASREGASPGSQAGEGDEGKEKGEEGKESEGSEDESSEDEEGQEGEEEPEETNGSFDTRLANVGPAVRPNFGTGLRIEPETVSPGGEATLRMSKENATVEGFGTSRSGHNLRLGGRVVDIAKESAGAAEGSEYVELENGRLIALGKEGAYVKENGDEFVPDDEAGVEEVGDGVDEGEGSFVRLDDPAVQGFEGEEDGDGHQFVEVREREGKGAVVAGGAKVTLAGGTFEGRIWGKQEGVPLKDSPLLRQAWDRDHIRFHVPDDAQSSVVTVECNQLAGAPLLQVSHVPTARLTVEVQRKSGGIRLDSSHSSDEDETEGPILRRWRINGVSAGHGEAIGSPMSPRRTIYSVELTVTDKAGNSDTAKMQLLRLPTPKFGVGLADRKVRRAIGRDREAIERAVEVERPTKVELDGYTDHPRSGPRNLNLALKEATKVRLALLPEPTPISPGTRPITVEELAHGEACPLDRVAGRHLRNRHVDLFVLGEGVIVKHAKRCHPGNQKSVRWHPPPAAEPLAAISSVPSSPVAPPP